MCFRSTSLLLTFVETSLCCVVFDQSCMSASLHTKHRKTHQHSSVHFCFCSTHDMQGHVRPGVSGCDLGVTHLPEGGFAAARTEVLLLSMVVMPALAILIVCCSMACQAQKHSWKIGGYQNRLGNGSHAQTHSPAGSKLAEVQYSLLQLTCDRRTYRKTCTTPLSTGPGKNDSLLWCGVSVL